MKRKLPILLVTLIALAVLAMFALTPARDEVTVRYRAGDITVPITIDNVSRIEEYYLYGEELYQVVVWQNDALVPVVFTPFDLVSYRKSLISPLPVVQVHGDMYHTYDNVLQGVKYELRRAFVIEKYNEYFGRDPSEAERYLEMDKLIMKVQLEQLDVRLRHYPEAVIYSIGQADGTVGAIGDQIIRLLLTCGMEPSRIVTIFAK